jgi:hypothetical protein
MDRDQEHRSALGRAGWPVLVQRKLCFVALLVLTACGSDEGPSVGTPDAAEADAGNASDASSDGGAGEDAGCRPVGAPCQEPGGVADSSLCCSQSCGGTVGGPVGTCR